MSYLLLNPRHSPFPKLSTLPNRRLLLPIVVPNLEGNQPIFVKYNWEWTFALADHSTNEPVRIRSRTCQSKNNVLKDLQFSTLFFWTIIPVPVEQTKTKFGLFFYTFKQMINGNYKLNIGSLLLKTTEHVYSTMLFC